MTAMDRLFSRGRLAATPIEEDEPDEWEAANFVEIGDVDRQLQDQAIRPPNFLTPFARKIQAVYTQPSDNIFFQTYAIDNVSVQNILAQGDKGMACRATISVPLATAGTGVWIAQSDSALRTGLASNATMLTMAFLIATPQPITFAIASGLFAVGFSATPIFVSVAFETYNPDAYNWEPWNPGGEG